MSFRWSSLGITLFLFIIFLIWSHFLHVQKHISFFNAFDQLWWSMLQRKQGRRTKGDWNTDFPKAPVCCTFCLSPPVNCVKCEVLCSESTTTPSDLIKTRTSNRDEVVYQTYSPEPFSLSHTRSNTHTATVLFVNLPVLACISTTPWAQATPLN